MKNIFTIPNLLVVGGLALIGLGVYRGMQTGILAPSTTSGAASQTKNVHPFGT